MHKIKYNKLIIYKLFKINDVGGLFSGCAKLLSYASISD